MPVEAVGVMSKGGARTHDYGFIRPKYPILTQPYRRKCGQEFFRALPTELPWNLLEVLHTIIPDGARSIYWHVFMNPPCSSRPEPVTILYVIVD